MSERNTTPAFAIGGETEAPRALEGHAHFASVLGVEAAGKIAAAETKIAKLPIRRVETMPEIEPGR